MWFISLFYKWGGVAQRGWVMVRDYWVTQGAHNPLWIFPPWPFVINFLLRLCSVLQMWPLWSFICFTLLENLTFSLYGAKTRNLGNGSSTWLLLSITTPKRLLILWKWDWFFTAFKNISNRSSLTLYLSMSLAWCLFVMEGGKLFPSSRFFGWPNN